MAFGSDGTGSSKLEAPLAQAGEGIAGPTSGERVAEPSRPRVAIVGVPNAGKSSLFHRLTRRFSAAANYPYTTLQSKEAVARLGGAEILLIDTPGCSGLELHSEDEAPTRALLAAEPPDAIIQVVDACNLARSLALTAQLADLGIPLVICLNMVDAALDRGLAIDARRLSVETGVPVVAACAADGRGLRRLGPCLKEARPPRPVAYPPFLEQKLAALDAPTRAAGIQRLLGAARPGLERGQSLLHALLEAHQDWARGVTRAVSRPTGLEPRRSFWDLLGRAALHPVGGWLLLLGCAVLTYLLVAQVGVGILAAGLERFVAGPIVATLAAWTGPGLLHEILVGPYGLVSLGLLNALCSVLPILSVFYLLFGLLEDVGYFPLLSVQLDRVLRLAGLTGKAVLPITLGFGCNSVATLATRCLESPRQRLVACFLIALGVPCAVQLGVMVAILAAVPLWVPLGLVLSIIAVQLAAGTLLARLLPRDHREEFLVELPPLRHPWWRNVLLKTRHRLVEFIVEATPMFVASAVLLQLLHYTGALDGLRNLLAPVVVHGLGMPREFSETLLLTLARREVGAVMLKGLADAGMLDLRQIFVGLLVMTLFVPCMSNTLMLGKVVGWARTALIVVAVIAVALGLGTLANGLWP